MKQSMNKCKKSRCISRFISLVIAIMMASTVFALPIPAAAVMDENDVAYAVTGGYIYFDQATGTITGYDGDITNVTIPSQINGTDVINVGNCAFDNCKTLLKVTLPDSVRTIENSAFDYCFDLTEVKMSEGVTHIGGRAFYGCNDLEKMDIPTTVISIGSDAFSGCFKLESVDLPGGLTSLGDSAFCSAGLTSVVIPKGLKHIGRGVFEFCNNLSSVSIPSGVTSIGAFAFNGCSLTTVTIPSSVISIGQGAFNSGVTIRGYSGTYAQTYAKLNNLPFVAIDAVSKSTQTITGKKSFSKTFGNKAFSLGAKAKTTLTYKSSNTKLATVSSKGVVTLKNPGTVKITVTAKETSKYKKATKTITIKTALKKPSLTAKAYKGRKTKLTWGKVYGATRYQVYMYDAKKKKYVRKITKGSKTRTAWHKRMIKGKTYRYKVRAYRVVDGKKVYGPFSAVKKVKAK